MQADLQALIDAALAQGDTPTVLKAFNLLGQTASRVIRAANTTPKQDDDLHAALEDLKTTRVTLAAALERITPDATNRAKLYKLLGRLRRKAPPDVPA